MQTIEIPDGVAIGKQEYLYLTGGQHSVQAYFEGRQSPPPSSIDRFCNNLADRRAFCLERDIGFSTCIFPDKLFALRNHFVGGDALTSLYQRAYAPHLSGFDRKSVIYPLEALEFEDSAFYRTDTHYSAKGALSVTRRILQDHFSSEIIEQAASTALSAFADVDNYCGDLGRKFEPHRTEHASVLRTARLKITAAVHNGIQAGNDGAIVFMLNRKALTDKTLLIFGDSFFRQQTYFLSLVFRKVIFCRTRYFHGEMVDATGPDVIFCGQAERYLSRCFSDESRPHFLSYPYIKGKPLRPSKEFVRLWPKFVHQGKLITPNCASGTTH